MFRAVRSSIVVSLTALSLLALLVACHDAQPQTTGVVVDAVDDAAGAGVCLEAPAPLDDDAAAFCGRCGDGFCAAQCGEDSVTCKKDCSGSSSLEASLEASFCGRCGDGYCAAQCGENSLTCKKDCSDINA